MAFNIIILVKGLFLSVGILLHCRIYVLLHRRKNGAIIDKLFKSNTIISGFCHPVVLVYYISSHLLYPMSDYIGKVGCLSTVHFLDAFVRFYNFCFPASIALVRYLFVVQHLWVRQTGMPKIVNYTIAFSVIIPIIMTLSVQFPYSENLHFAFNRCIGRFETYFNPLHPGIITDFCIKIYFKVCTKYQNNYIKYYY